MKIYRNLTWNEGIIFFKDFASGVKQNWKQFILIGLVGSLIFEASVLFAVFLKIDYIKYIMLAIFIAILLPILMVQMCEVPIYKNTFFKYQKSAFYMFIKKPIVYIFYLILMLPFLLLLVPFIPPLGLYIIFGVGFFIYSPISLLVWMLYNQYIFDEYINKTLHPELYKRGINDVDKVLAEHE